ncbi:RidA family protein [Accumulibacter sp.]|uniref:RidA family protein n=1 Tax=Candidatus Accumulibacter proximus TaxID=2954385 RepID=A0A935UGZ3_9PROT|nr:RidA family protein [Accumulibacter sp.]MBK7674948.1 RidA family protein [Candidatus Accumulibacter proximus]MBL8375708.1 RidA family protein [Accumulibacter sp.]
MAIERHGTTQRYSDICAYGNTIYLVETPQTLDSNVATQTHEVLAGIENLLEQAGSDKTRLLMATIYLRDIDDAIAVNAVWDRWIPRGTAPARVCVEAKLAHHDFLIEIAVVAAR